MVRMPFHRVVKRLILGAPNFPGGRMRLNHKGIRGSDTPQSRSRDDGRKI